MLLQLDSSHGIIRPKRLSSPHPNAMAPPIIAIIHAQRSTFLASSLVCETKLSIAPTKYALSKLMYLAVDQLKSDNFLKSISVPNDCDSFIIDFV